MLKTNKVYQGDCLDLLPLIDSNSIDLIIIDPPYMTTKEKWDREETVNEKLSSELFRILKHSGSLYIWCGIGEKSQSLIRWFPIFNREFYFKDLITWKKKRGMGMRKGWLYTREEIMWFVKDSKKFVWNKEKQYNEEEKNEFKVGFSGYECLSEYKRITNVWIDIPEVLGNKNIKHFTPKPVKALERIISVHTKEGDIVLDCFAGSGTTGIACKNLNRQVILIEKESQYCELIKERFKSNE